MNWKRYAVGLLVGFVVLPGYGQEITLRHQFAAGESAKVKTTVDLRGNTLIGQQPADTDLHLEMVRLFHVNQLDPTGDALVEVRVESLKTQGKMNNEPLNETLTGERLDQVMFGLSALQLSVTSAGQVRTQQDFSLAPLGITLPPGGFEDGGFEIPTFPLSPVSVGQFWSKHGTVLQGNEVRTSLGEGDKVYQLQRVISSAQGRVAVIRYRETSDLSGLGLGGEVGPNSAATASQPGASLTVPGLRLQLEGEIMFNIDRGIMIESVQQGFWNLSMEMGTPGNPQSRTAVRQQGMQIRIRTQFVWNAPQNRARPNLAPQQKTEQPDQVIPPELVNPESEAKKPEPK